MQETRFRGQIAGDGFFHSAKSQCGALSLIFSTEWVHSNVIGSQHPHDFILPVTIMDHFP
jgi:hypothetical protein